MASLWLQAGSRASTVGPTPLSFQPHHWAKKYVLKTWTHAAWPTACPACGSGFFSSFATWSSWWARFTWEPHPTVLPLGVSQPACANRTNQRLSPDTASRILSGGEVS